MMGSTYLRDIHRCKRRIHFESNKDWGCDVRRFLKSGFKTRYLDMGSLVLPIDSVARRFSCEGFIEVLKDETQNPRSQFREGRVRTNRNNSWRRRARPEPLGSSLDRLTGASPSEAKAQPQRVQLSERDIFKKQLRLSIRLNLRVG
jgi:hypothetical protein